MSISFPTKRRVAHSFAHFAKGWGIARCATVLAMLMSFAAVYAQDATCGLTSMKDTAPLKYPPIARAAHVEGNVIFIVKFALSGSVDDLAVISGPQMLRSSAVAYIRALRANPYGGSRECPVVVRFVLGGNPAAPDGTVTQIDLQHVEIRASPSVLYTSYSTTTLTK